jgi:hypothetical protein
MILFFYFYISEKQSSGRRTEGSLQAIFFPPLALFVSANKADVRREDRREDLNY